MYLELDFLRAGGGDVVYASGCASRILLRIFASVWVIGVQTVGSPCCSDSPSPVATEPISRRRASRASFIDTTCIIVKASLF